MSQNAHFSVNTRLTRLLGETYRSSEVALKELVDNAWDADANNVWITLPTMITGEAIIVKDDGSGMTAPEMLGEYLNIASDKRVRSGDRTAKLKRKVKGRKGIGKFAGLILAGRMEISAIARGRICSLTIDKKELIENQNDLEAVPLPFSEAPFDQAESGTTITLSQLDTRLNFPVSERLREVLVQEYGREADFNVFVDGIRVSLEDVPGTTKRTEHKLPIVGDINLHFTIAEGKKLPKSPGIVLKVDGKVVGKPMFFGLDDDDEIPEKLVKRVYGEVEISGLDDFVTADWGSVIENSKAYQEVQEHVRSVVKVGLQETHVRDMSLQKARLKKQIDQRLQKLPEHRRQYAQEALNRILRRFYMESEERIATIADVALDAIEHDAYWAVLDRIGQSSHGDISSFAESLEQFGLVELSTIAAQTARRLQFLDYLDQLVNNQQTLEKDAHKALETNLWVLGRKYSTMSSNNT
ncbi:ATP-binding protein [Pararhizobium sp. PWRC1-1]|uniref:ATP-binding protein n=1 Tax=Pararhizobium sp. PWRC1-1 TaxID=2804566 RepID=UPI003CF441AC